MSKSQADERRKRRSTAVGIGPVAPVPAPEPVAPVKLARGTREGIEPVANQTEPPLDPPVVIDLHDGETVVIDPDDATIEGDAIDALDLSGDADSIDAHMLELAR